MKIIDLSLPLYTGMPVFPGDPEASIEVIQTLQQHGWELRRLHINSHDSTHVNVPAHAVANGKRLQDYSLDCFCGEAVIYRPGLAMQPDKGVIFRDRNIDAAIAEAILRARPKFVALSDAFEFDLQIEKDLLAEGIISYERLTNLDQLPDTFMFYGLPLNILSGDGSPVRAMAVIE